MDIVVWLRTLGLGKYEAYLTMGEFSAARKHLERAQGLYDPDQHLRYRFQYGQDIGTTVMCYLSWALWHLGYVDRASQPGPRGGETC
jgi:hypothetical protein